MVTALQLLHLHSPAGEMTLNCGVGNIPDLRFAGEGGRVLGPLHSAPWRDEPDVQSNERLPADDRRLAGDYFCAPFGLPPEPDVPPHGWPANSAWDTVSQGESEALLQLRRPVKGATLQKHLALAADAPLLYQEHTLSGGEGFITCAHHPMVRSRGRARLSVSPKRALFTPEKPLEERRGVLGYPQRSSHLREAKAARGGSIDITNLPIGENHEDFAVLAEEPRCTIGWTALLREEEDDIAFFLKDARVLPVTMLWFSNGGRDYVPWNGRHRGVLGIEDGCTPGAEGDRTGAIDNPVSREGVPTCLPLAAGRVHRIVHVTGCIARPQGWGTVFDIRTEGETLVIEGNGGKPVQLNWQSSFLS